MLNSSDKRVPNSLCKVNIGVAKVAVVNVTSEPIVMRKGQEVGKWENVYWDDLRFRDTPTDLLCSQGKPMSAEKRLDTLLESLVKNRNGRMLSPQMQKIVRDSNQVFAVEDSELTQTSLVTHDINTGDTKPIRQKTRPVPIGARDEFKDILSSLLQRGIIEHSTSDVETQETSQWLDELRSDVDYGPIIAALEEGNLDKEELTAVAGIKHSITKGYNSRENGVSERAIGTIQRMLKKKVGTTPTNGMKELEFDVPDESHMLPHGHPNASTHAPWTRLCRGQDFPAFKGGPSFALANCCVSKTMTAADLIAVLPHPARALPIECVLEAARVFAIWMQTGSVALKTQRIMNLDDRVVDPRSLGFAYAVFRKKCAHVSTMARAIEPATIMRHGSLSRGWPTVPQRIFELGWLVARKLDKNDFDLNSMMDRIHNRILIVVPMVLRRMAWMSGGCRTRVFFYGDFSAIKTKMDSLFTDDLGAVVLILPPEEPRKVTSWLAIMSAINLWTTCGTHVYLVNGPRTVNIVSWEHVTMKMRAHILSYVSEQPEHAQLIVDVLQQNIGVMDPRAAWAAVGVLKNATEWMSEESTRTFYQFLRSQLEPLLTLEELRLAPFRAHKRKEPGLPAPVEESSERTSGGG
ncbi:hypothetical protein OSTOST_15771 [Ostertagia ostertagi]